jgi:hypothetical protein
MISILRSLLSGALVVSAAMPTAGTAETGSLSEALVVGEGFDLADGSPAYSEENRERFVGGRMVSLRTLYRNPTGDTVAERTLDFSGSSTQPDFRIVEQSGGHEEAVSVERGKVHVRYRASGKNPYIEKTIEVPEPFVIDGGFHPFLKEQWAALTAGKRVAFNFVVPSRLDYIRFVAYEDRQASVPGKDRVFVAVPVNRLLRLLVPSIRTRYAETTHGLLEYRGLSNLQGADGKGRQVRLSYRAPGL